jgi:anti-anti-sigma factor
VSEARVVFAGHLDMGTVPALMEQVQSAGAVRRVVLDLSQLEFVDSTGVRGLLTLKQRFANQGRELQIEGVRPEICDILDILGVKELILGG